MTLNFHEHQTSKCFFIPVHSRPFKDKCHRHADPFRDTTLGQREEEGDLLALTAVIKLLIYSRLKASTQQQHNFRQYLDHHNVTCVTDMCPCSTQSPIQDLHTGSKLENVFIGGLSHLPGLSSQKQHDANKAGP